MKELKVIPVKQINYNSSITEISGLLDRLDKNEINQVPWPAHPYKPSASFTISHGPDCIFLKYFVTEKQIRATYESPNSPVWEDTCVEFFFSLNNGPRYYNFEVNCIGTILAAYGIDRDNRQFLSPDIIATIKTFGLIDKFSDPKLINWDIIIIIPFSAFIHDKISSLSGADARANFFKCGDKLTEPHYLSWNSINAPEPDFHLPEHFGKLHFAEKAQ